MADPIQELKQLREELSATPGWAVRMQMHRVARTGRVFLDNWRELEGMIGRFSTDTAFALEVWGPGGTRFDAFLDALDRPLHNFIASARTLVEHTRIVSRSVLDENSSVRVEYDQRVDELFVNSPRSRFVHDLRNYMLHYELPATAGSWSWSRGEDTVHAISLECESLKRWDGWKALARQFIDDSGETIDLHETLSGYVGDMNRFQEWFTEAVTDANRAVLAEAQKIADRGNVLADQLRPMFGYDE